MDNPIAGHDVEKQEKPYEECTSLTLKLIRLATPVIPIIPIQGSPESRKNSNFYTIHHTLFGGYIKIVIPFVIHRNILFSPNKVYIFLLNQHKT